jgi:DNA polymerase-3 subunit gamma/tau
LRSVRKLLARFNSVLWEDDSRLRKLKGQIDILEEDLQDIEIAEAGTELGKKCEGIIKKAAKLEAEGLGELIPIAQIRRASYWSHLAPLGRHKCIIMENAENMQEGAKNSLLKILEEPPPHLSIILTSSRPLVLLPTVLSRLREYRFIKRKPAEEKEVLNRIFRENNEEPSSEKVSSIGSYMASFLPVKSDTLYSLSGFFAASVAAEAARERRAAGLEISALLIDLGKFSAGICETGGQGRPAGSVKDALQKVMGIAEKFEIPGLFMLFLEQCSMLVLAWLRDGRINACPEKTLWADQWRGELNRSMRETEAFNINPSMALERLFEALKAGMA